MMIPLSREKFEDLVPLAATGAQYSYLWGSFSDFLRRLLMSFAAVIAAVVIGYFLGETAGEPFRLIVGIIAGCYWLWGPVYFASKRNWDYRRYKYSGFWRGEVIDKFVTDELVSTGENVNKRGDLIVIENREKRLNLEIGDDTGFVTRVKVPLKREHQAIRRGDAAEMVVVSSRPDLGRIAKISDVFVPDSNVWVSDYPYVRRDAFQDVSHQLKSRAAEPLRDRPPSDPRYANDRYLDRYSDDPQNQRQSRSNNRPQNPPYWGDRYADDPYPVDDPYSVDEPYPDDRYPTDRHADQRSPQRRPRQSPDPYDQGWEERDRSPRDWDDRDQLRPERYEGDRPPRSRRSGRRGDRPRR